MRRVQITKNLINKGAWFMGLSKKQIVTGAVGFAAAGLTIYALWGKLQVDLMMLIVFIELLLVVAVGFVHINGVSLIQVVLSMFRKGNIRYFNRKDGIYSDETEEK